MRLGYACLNRTLGVKMRTCRLANATPERVATLARENLAEVRRMAEWNAEHGIGLLRLSSDIVPFAGRADVRSEWRVALADDLAETGRVVRACGQRVSAHPGQFIVLASPRPEVARAAVADLAAHADFFDLMGVPADLVIHLGGVYGDRAATEARFLDAARSLPPSVRDKLVLENDDVSWNAAETASVAERAGLPMVFDPFHDEVLPSPDLAPADALRRALRTWPETRRPKVHFSDQAPGKPEGAHADRVDPARFAAWLARVPRGLRDFDVMIEAKDKELAVLPLLPLVAPLSASAGRTSAPSPPRASRARREARP